MYRKKKLSNGLLLISSRSALTTAFLSASNSIEVRSSKRNLLKLFTLLHGLSTQIIRCFFR